MEPVPQGWAGVDVGKGHHWVCLIDEDGTTLWSSKVVNDETAILEAISEIRSRAAEVTWDVATFRAHPQAEIIESLPGMGPILGAELIAAAGDLNGYANAGRLASAEQALFRFLGTRVDEPGTCTDPCATPANCVACSTCLSTQR